jgi:drug/metabolite transporter (DMT)-like permease
MTFTIGILLGIFAMFSWGIADFFVKNAVDKIGAHRTFIYSYLFGIIPLLIYFFLYPTYPLFTKLLIFIFLFGTLFNFLGYLFFYRGLEIENYLFFLR